MQPKIVVVMGEPALRVLNDLAGAALARGRAARGRDPGASRRRSTRSTRPTSTTRSTRRAPSSASGAPSRCSASGTRTCRRTEARDGTGCDPGSARRYIWGSMRAVGQLITFVSTVVAALIIGFGVPGPMAGDRRVPDCRQSWALPCRARQRILERGPALALCTACAAEAGRRRRRVTPRTRMAAYRASGRRGLSASASAVIASTVALARPRTTTVSRAV